MLTDAELLRYSRQILLADVDIAGQLKLKHSKVLIVGLGGLGSPVAMYLAAAGVGELHLADFDVVDSTNLQRQVVHTTASEGQLKVASAQARLQALNPFIQVHTHSERLAATNLEQLVQGMHVVLDCTDNFRIRDELNAACFAQQVAWVSGAAIRLSGQLTAFDPRSADSPCYRCLFADTEEENLGCNEAGVLGPLVGVIGSLQAAEAVKMLVGFGRSLVGRLLLIDIADSRFRELRLSRDPDCSVCGKQR
ncbi:HesA/MoeB/ThiF family protein [Thiopseudomonas acetoxidans]|uniref:Molybdopterin-synthase adenylyltransferase MoeB n=1 Tax=Thiopseudomonas acetoxidans TaxID=3041622 RepID=A0ABT7SLC2_9GAMM|nr:molybdopterin-synthase adenylyltransferase MoeB [Thiopseudomonas sp. CY1220]MDM7856992.1 molybdopterin-synthase adenylyltransferase MoeB [Thiopseudomonas sp. CY1220]